MHAGRGQLLVDDQLLKSRRTTAPGHGPVGHDQSGRGEGSTLVGPGCCHLSNDWSYRLAQCFGLVGQISRQPAPLALQCQVGDRQLERADITEELPVGHGALEVEVRVVLPREADASEHLDALLGTMRRSAEAHRAGHSCTQGTFTAFATIRFGRTPGGGSVPGDGGALLDSHQHVGQAVLDPLELADGSPELHPHLGVVRGRVEAPAGQPRALRRHQHKSQIPHFGRRDVRQKAVLGQGRPLGHQLAQGARAVQRFERVDHQTALRWSEQAPAPDIERGQHQVCLGQAQHRTQRPADRSSLSSEGAGSEGHGGRGAAVGQTGQVTSPLRRAAVAGQHAGHQQGGEDGTGEERIAHLLEHHGQLAQGVTLTTISLCHVQTEPTLRGHLLPGRRQIAPRRLGHGARHGRWAVHLEPAPHAQAQRFVILADRDGH